MSNNINADTCRYCFLDLDVDNHRKKLATAASFVNATDSRYGFTSKDLRQLGGSELSRINDLISTDHGACVLFLARPVDPFDALTFFTTSTLYCRMEQQKRRLRRN
jgi:hypothetical protein